MKKETIEHVVIRFSGDSGDGMQLVGQQFSKTTALMGNDFSTFPDFPAEIRAPIGTVPGVSGFQIHFGSQEINTPGDEADVLVAMNPASLKAHLSVVKNQGVIIANEDSFNATNIKKAGYKENPLESGELRNYQVIKCKMTSQTQETLKDTSLDNKGKMRCKNFYALGLVYYLYDRTLDNTLSWLKEKFKKKPDIMEANCKVLKAGYNFGDITLAQISKYIVPKAKIGKGTYRHINGNSAVAMGLVAASIASERELFLGSYPITPASDILHDLSTYKRYGVKTFQAEDEIAAVCSAIGASFGGALSVTTSSGPGIALKGEAIGLAIIYELPLVVVNVQRAGPSTGLPTKTEQSDFNLAMFGRNGESPMIVIAPAHPSDCFEMAFEAARLSMQHMTPVTLLSDGYIANGAEPWKLPDLEKYEHISLSPNPVPSLKVSGSEEEAETSKKFLPYLRDPKNLVRPWVSPGTPGHEHRLGGIEKEDKTGNVSYDPKNHQKMCELRAEKVARVADNIPLQDIYGEELGDLVVISWGGTFGACRRAVEKNQKDEKQKISHIHLRYLNPLPKNFQSLLTGFKQAVVCELNGGQMFRWLKSEYGTMIPMTSYTKLEGLPFKISELQEAFNHRLQKKNEKRIAL